MKLCHLALPVLARSQDETSQLQQSQDEIATLSTLLSVKQSAALDSGVDHLLDAVGSRNVTQMASLLQDLVEETIADGPYELDGDVTAALDMIKRALLGDIRGALNEAHCYDQSELHTQILCFERCEEQFHVGDKSCGERCDGMAHTQCRYKLLEKYTDHITKCRALDQFVKAFVKNDCPEFQKKCCLLSHTTWNCGGLCAGQIAKLDVDSSLGYWITKQVAIFQSAYEQWMKLHKACTASYHDYVEVDADCDCKQADCEARNCEWDQCKYINCEMRYNECWGDCEAEWERTSKAKECLEKDRKIDWSATEKIECYVNVLLEKPSKEELLATCGKEDCFNEYREHMYHKCNNICVEVDFENGSGQLEEHKRREHIEGDYSGKKTDVKDQSSHQYADQDVTEESKDYAHFHHGHCASGWIRGENTFQQSIDDCAARCRARDDCGYFAYSATKTTGTNCAMYTVGGGCRDDDKYPHYEAYQMVAAGGSVRTRHRGAGENRCTSHLDLDYQLPPCCHPCEPRPSAPCEQTKPLPEPSSLCPSGLADNDMVALHAGDGSSKCYFVNRNLGDDINAGRSWCEAHGGELASIHSADDNNAVIGIARGASVYIGALGTECPNEHKLCTWTWEDGSVWNDPNAMGIANDGLNHNNFRLHETRIALHSDRRWHDWVHGQSNKGVVCQRKVAQPVNGQMDKNSYMWLFYGQYGFLSTDAIDYMSQEICHSGEHTYIYGYNLCDCIDCPKLPNCDPPTCTHAKACTYPATYDYRQHDIKVDCSAISNSEQGPYQTGGGNAEFCELGIGACNDRTDRHPTYKALREADNSPATCYAACIREYGEHCTGFDTRDYGGTTCLVYSSNGNHANEVVQTNHDHNHMPSLVCYAVGNPCDAAQAVDE